MWANPTPDRLMDSAHVGHPPFGPTRCLHPQTCITSSYSARGTHTWESSDGAQRGHESRRLMRGSDDRLSHVTAPSRCCSSFDFPVLHRCFLPDQVNEPAKGVSFNDSLHASALRATTGHVGPAATPLFEETSFPVNPFPLLAPSDASPIDPTAPIDHRQLPVTRVKPKFNPLIPRLELIIWLTQ